MMAARDQTYRNEDFGSFQAQLTWRPEKKRIAEANRLGAAARRGADQISLERVSEHRKPEDLQRKGTDDLRRFEEQLEAISSVIGLTHVSDGFRSAQDETGNGSNRNQLLSNEERRRVRSVPLHSLLEVGSVILATVCLLSFVSWALADWDLIIVNPFVALLGFVTAPFVYLMGRAARI